MVRAYIWKSIRKFKEQLHKAAKLKTTTHQIALGMGWGTFIGFLPLFGFQFLVGLVAVFLFRINKITTFLGIILTNPVTIPPVFAFNYYIGKLLVGGPTETVAKFFSLENIVNIAKPLIVGSLVVGTIAAIIAYYITYTIVLSFRKELKALKKLKKLKEK